MQYYENIEFQHQEEDNGYEQLDLHEDFDRYQDEAYALEIIRSMYNKIQDFKFGKCKEYNENFFKKLTLSEFTDWIIKNNEYVASLITNE